ncbi:DsbA family oxidoreductase [Homoserinibacter sp. YIM 151385]|uniref:DsbA family oxidoreductase n=1 Tax=Homoserinibacter sp. YIM 151385 TaxID=2985506 RepID=UPI0022F0C2FB|nr:DsbA family oxidoreductase [Homoserinibacter sp. YIM 151385]WBU38425.1 DsbA family oxidoreductase [Homoserinibacter sp. YIM 151385]
MTTSSAPIKVEIWSDVQCPWCYIGKRKFEAAVEAFDGDVDVEYRSFELAPDTPVDFEGTAADYLSQRKGLPADQVQTMLDRVTGIAAQVGLDYRFDDVHQTNTVLAHEALHFAKAHGLQVELKERLLLAYFTEGRHLGRAEELADLGADVGLDRDELLAALGDHRHLADVKADVAQATAYGIQGVPFFVFDGRLGVSGAQETATFADVLAKVRDDRVEA